MVIVIDTHEKYILDSNPGFTVCQQCFLTSCLVYFGLVTPSVSEDTISSYPLDLLRELNF